ncbi:hypothetical protein N5A93_18820, partial [Roseovarius sp. EGI FJ00037]|uniref:hypothetical protein n=1 Tax=Roseovarius salincola TaxID=2978479 RepID=UPI0022A86E03
MIIFALRRSLRLRRATREDGEVALILSPEGLEYRHGENPVSVAWSEIIDPLDAASHLRRRDGGASLLLIRKDVAALSRPVLRRLFGSVLNSVYLSRSMRFQILKRRSARRTLWQT